MDWLVSTRHVANINLVGFSGMYRTGSIAGRVTLVQIFAGFRVSFVPNLRTRFIKLSLLDYRDFGNHTLHY